MSLPEDSEGLAQPVESEPLGPFNSDHGKLMYFRTEDLDISEEDEEVTLGLGVFQERTVPNKYFAWDDEVF